jgi:hypothetical protein
MRNTGEMGLEFLCRRPLHILRIREVLNVIQTVAVMPEYKIRLILISAASTVGFSASVANLVDDAG